MLPELGLLSLLTASAFAFLLATTPWIGMYCRRPQLLQHTASLSYAVLLFIVLSMALLGYAFATDDFSVMYVAQHSNSRLPIWFKIAAMWGGHEGSMLFWLFSLALWAAIVATIHRRIDPVMLAQVLAVIGVLTTIFALFILVYSNPFERLLPAVREGRDLNPMLQDIALIIHPPLLYLGYVGFAVNFAFALSALLSRQMDKEIAGWSRPYALISWMFLTAGIALGAWWAYSELGWGGWWFWDPVENVSLLPWLSGIALIHALLATERRGIMPFWSLLLSIFTFALSLLGTFVVRSGILTSVHAFALDPARGTILLWMLAIILISALMLFALRAKSSTNPVTFHYFSKESLLLLANILIITALLTVLLGTFYPLIFRLYNLSAISVGAPYFNRTFVLPVLLALLLMTLLMGSHWQSSPSAKKSNLLTGLLLSLIAGNSLPFLLGQWQWMPTLTLTLALWMLISGLMMLRPLSFRRLGIFLIHAGVAITVIGSTVSSYYTQESSVKMRPGSLVMLQGYQFDYQQTQLVVGANYTAEQGHIQVSWRGQVVAQLTPERRHYPVRGVTMNEPGIQSTLFADFYALLGEKIDTEYYAVRIYYKPFISWIWSGAGLMIFGTLLIVLIRGKNKEQI